jgi:hypothetical protein
MDRREGVRKWVKEREREKWGKTGMKDKRTTEGR